MVLSMNNSISEQSHRQEVVQFLITHEKIRRIFVMHQNVNLLTDWMILDCLGVQNRNQISLHGA